MSKKPIIAIAGATGLAGNEIMLIIDELKLPFSEVRLLASKDSRGELFEVGGESVAVELLDEAAFEDVDIAFFATCPVLSEKFVPAAEAAGAVVIDNSGFYSAREDAALVVPRINTDAISAGTRIIANPSCATMQLVSVLKVIHEAAGVRRVVVSTYQSVSGAGKDALDELWGQTLAIFNQRDLPADVFGRQIAFNCLPQAGAMRKGGHTAEEERIARESRKILGLPGLCITATAVRVPAFHSDAQSVNVETERQLSPEELVQLLKVREGITVYPEAGEYPTQLDAAGSDEIHVGRIRPDESVSHGLAFWSVSDNIRGSARSAVEIAKRVIEVRN